MIGSYSFSSLFAGEAKPALVMVLSTGKNGTAEIILGGIGSFGKYWRHISAKVVSEQLEFIPREESGLMTLKWDKVDSGKVIIYPRQQDLGKKIITLPFTRLDG